MPNTYRFNQRVEKAKGLGLSGINRELKHYANIFKGGIPKSVKNRVQHLVQAKAELEAFSKYGLNNITEKYLPKKLEESKSF